MKKDYIDEMILRAVELDDIELLIFVLSRLSKDADKDADKIIRAIIGANHTDYGIGDGKIFVAPLDEAIRVRTRETGDAAL